MAQRMTHPTFKRGRTLCGQDFRDLRHRIKETNDLAYSAAKFARDLDISTSLLQLIETGDRNITPPVAAAYYRREQALIDWLKDLDEVNARTVTWLVDALDRYKESLSRNDRKRLAKLLESKA